jgi:hypothetical protein
LTAENFPLLTKIKNRVCISTSTVTPEMLERVHGNIVKRANANRQNFEHFNKIIFVEVFDCCVTSQTHQNGCLGIQ